MKILAIDTATQDLVTGLVDTASGESTDQVLTGTRGHNEHLMPTVMELVAESSAPLADLDAIVVGQGPGPFTGLRVGMATAQALGQSLHIPVYGVCTHDAIAATVNGEPVVVATDARRKEIYWATYDAGVRTEGPAVVKPANLELPHQVSEVIIPEHLHDALPENLRALDHRWVAPSAHGLVAVANLDADPAPLMPFYLRRPDAVPPKTTPLSPAIPRVDL